MPIPGVPGTDRPLVQWLLVLMCVLVLALAVLLVRRERAASDAARALREELTSRAEVERRLESRLARERSAREAFELSLGREREARQLPSVALRAGLARDGKPAQQLRLQPGASRIEFVLPLPSPRFRRYRAALRPFSGGEDIWVHAALRPSADHSDELLAILPADVLSPGAYELSLAGIASSGRRQDVATFTFDVQP